MLTSNTPLHPRTSQTTESAINQLAVFPLPQDIMEDSI
jgi:hypothetical protein